MVVRRSPTDARMVSIIKHAAIKRDSCHNDWKKLEQELSHGISVIFIYRGHAESIYYRFIGGFDNSLTS